MILELAREQIIRKCAFGKPGQPGNE